MAMADGTVIIDTNIDTSGAARSTAELKDALRKTTESVKKLGKEVNTAIKTSAEQNQSEVESILANTEKGAKSKAASLAAIYRKQGLSQEEVFRKAWSEIEKSGKNGSRKAKKHIQSISKQAKATTTSISSMFKKLGTVLVATFSFTALVAFGKQALELGSDLQEVQNVVDVTFTTMSDKVNEFAKNAKTTAGLSETMAKQYTGTFGSMAKAFGFAEAGAFDMASSLTQLSGDVASFYNLTQDEAYTKLKSVFTGETESLKDLGVVMTQSALDAYAMANGFGKTTSVMTEQEKVALRYAFVVDQLSAASGDFERTSGGWANQIRVLKLQLESFMGTVGQGLINVFTPVIQVINTLLGKLQVLGESFKAFTELIFGKQSSGSAGASITAAAESVDTLAESTQDATEASEAAAKAQNGYLSGLDEINRYSSNESSSGTSTTTPTIGGSISIGTVDTSATEESAETALGGLVGKIKSLMADLSAEFAKIDTSRLTTSLNNLRSSLAPFAEKIGEGLYWLLTEVLAPLGTWVANEVVPRFLDTLSGCLDVLNPILEALQPLFDWLWNDILVPIASWTGNVFLDIWDGINNALSIFADWCAENPGMIETIAIVIGSFAAAWGLVNAAIKIWNVIGIIATAVTGGLGAAVAFLTSPIGLVILAIGALIAIGVLLYQNWEEISAWATEIWGAICDWFEETIAKIGQFFSNLWAGIKETFSNVGNWFKEKFTLAVSGIKNAFSSVKKFFADIWNGIKDTFGNVSTWFKDKFSAAWTAVKNVFSKGGEIFSGIKDGILGGLKSVINGLIGGINDVIAIPFDGLNTALGKLKKIDIMGAKPFSFLPTLSVPQIPMLATGAVIPPNAPFMAVLGDQKHGTNIETPEGLLRQIIREEMGNNRSGGGQYRFTAQMNRRIVFDEIIEEAKLRQSRTGDNPFALT